jgi:hypothetical protein
MPRTAPFEAYPERYDRWFVDQAGLTVRAWGQTLTRPREDIDEIDPLRPGTGQGAFVVMAAEA